MISAQKSPVFRSIFRIIVSQLLKRNFHNIYCNSFTAATDECLLLGNHASWWDGLVSFQLTEKKLGYDFNVMMTEDGLKQFPYFKRLGAFSINKQSKRDIITSLSYAETLLQTKKAVWIFPQGEEQHVEIRPLQFQSGPVFLLQKRQETPIQLITYYYTFLHHKKPELFIHVSDPFYWNDIKGTSKKEKLQALEEKMTAQLDFCKSCIVEEKLEHYQKITL